MNKIKGTRQLKMKENVAKKKENRKRKRLRQKKVKHN